MLCYVNLYFLHLSTIFNASSTNIYKYIILKPFSLMLDGCSKPVCICETHNITCVVLAVTSCLKIKVWHYCIMKYD